MKFRYVERLRIELPISRIRKEFAETNDIDVHVREPGFVEVRPGVHSLAVLFGGSFAECQHNAPSFLRSKFNPKQVRPHAAFLSPQLVRRPGRPRRRAIVDSDRRPERHEQEAHRCSRAPNRS